MKKYPISLILLVYSTLGISDTKPAARERLVRSTKEPVIYSRQHDVLAAAIRHGSASGIMQGEVAEHFTRQFQSTSPLLVNVKVIKSLSRSNCKRLEVVFTQKDVSTPKGRTDATLKMQLNYCLDRTPPISAVGNEMERSLMDSISYYG